MRNLIRMDLYRMRKARGFFILLILAFVFGFVITPIGKLFVMLIEMTGDDATGVEMLFPPTATLSEIIVSPFPLMAAMLMLLSACIFFGADTDRGYIKNTIGLMPKRSYILLSKFIAVLLHNALFMIAAIIGNLIGTLLFQSIEFDSGVGHAILVLLTKYVLGLSLTALILLLVSGMGNKGLGTIAAVLFGSGLLMLICQLISYGVNLLFKTEGFTLANWMPDQLLTNPDPQQPYSILLGIGLTAAFLLLAIRAFEKRDLK